MGLLSGRKTVYVDSDVLVIGGGMAGCGATYEARYWGRDLNIVCVEKANIERSGAVAQGLYATTDNAAQKHYLNAYRTELSRSLHKLRASCQLKLQKIVPIRFGHHQRTT